MIDAPVTTDPGEANHTIDEDDTYKLLGLEKERCPMCGANLKLVGKPSYQGGTGPPICLNACHLGVAGKARFQASIAAFVRERNG